MAQSGDIVASVLSGNFGKSVPTDFADGQLFEILPALEQKDTPQVKRQHVIDLLADWYDTVQNYSLMHDTDVMPHYALEIHAANLPSLVPKGKQTDDYPTLIGYGTYSFLSEEVINVAKRQIQMRYSEPHSIDDAEDPLKLLASKYVDDYGYSRMEELTVYELAPAQDDVYSFKLWDKKSHQDPLDTLFLFLDTLPENAFAGLSIAITLLPDDWTVAPRMRIRSIEDPEYREHISGIERIGRFFRGEPMPEEQALSMDGYQKSKLGEPAKQERDNIFTKMDGNAFQATIRMYASDRELADQMAEILIQSTAGKYNHLYVADMRANIRDAALRLQSSHSFVISEEEIATLWHVPDELSKGIRRHMPKSAYTKPPDMIDYVPFGSAGDFLAIIERAHELCNGRGGK